MNVKRFTARTSRDALKEVRHVFGDDAIVLSTRPCPEGVEVLAMPPEAVQQFEKVAVKSAAAASPPVKGSFFSRKREAAAPPPNKIEPTPEASVSQDVERLGMSTLSFQEYVRERMLRRRKAQIAGEPDPVQGPDLGLEAVLKADERIEPRGLEPVAPAPSPRTPVRAQAVAAAEFEDSAPARPARADVRTMPARAVDSQAVAALQREREEMVRELRSMKGLIEERFGALAFMEKMQREPRQAQLSQRLLDAGFSPQLIRKLVASLPAEIDENAWASSVLERNLATAERETPIEDQGGVFALVGPTGVGKTTATAKIAAAFAARHGASNLGLITLDAYRIGAQEQLRAYGRILGVTVHTAHDRTSLEDLLELLAGKKLVLIDTAGMAQRDARTAGLLEMLSHPGVQRLLVVNAASQGETIEDVVQAYRAARCRGVVLSKLDEAVKLGPALDSLIRHRLKVIAVSNGQRVPEDWHRLSATTLVQRALRAGAQGAWRLDGDDVNLVFASHGAGSTAAMAAMPAGMGA